MGKYPLLNIGTDTITVLVTSSDTTLTQTFLIHVHGMPPEILHNGLIQAVGTVAKDSSLVLSVDVSGTEPFTYTWFHDGDTIPDKSGNSISFEPLTDADTGAYRCIVSSDWGKDTTSSDYIITFGGTAPEILNNGLILAHGTVVKDSSLVLSIDVSGTKPIIFTWYYNGDTIPDKSGDSIFFESLKDTDTGAYSCIVSNNWGKDTTNSDYILSFGNQAPVWTQDTFTIAAAENEEKSIDLSAYCSDPDNDPISYYLNKELFTNDTIKGGIYSFTPWKWGC